MDVNQFGIDLAKQMQKELPYDHVGSKDMTVYGAIAEMVSMCGDGDYLEIGTWRGASAIVAAKTKMEYGLDGLIYCVDHFGGYHGQDAAIVHNDALNNFEKYNVSEFIKIVPGNSRPLPIIRPIKFECAFIDANHWKEEPYLDFVEIKNRINYFILMDDYDLVCRHTVIKCVERILQDFTDWKINKQGNSWALLERTINDY